MIGEEIEKLIKETVNKTFLDKKNNELPNDIIITDSIGEVIEKLVILHCRIWNIEDQFPFAKTPEEVVSLKKKLDISFKVKRPKLVQAINRMLEESIKGNLELVEDSVKIYKGFE